MSRTTDPLAAVKTLLESSDPDTVIQYDGTTYRVAPSGDKREGFYEILTQGQVKEFHCTASWRLDGSIRPLSLDEWSSWLSEGAETWFRSARYNESLAATTSDQEHPTGR